MRGHLWRIKKGLARLASKKYILFEGNNRTKRVALTFDDGPDPEFTDKVLEVLDRYGVKATFFFVGNNIEQHPQVVKRVKESGHLIGGHGYSHKRTTEISAPEFSEELEKNQKSMKAATGEPFVYFRPPYGDFNLSSLRIAAKKGMTTVLWSVDSRDFEKKGKDHVINNILDDGVGPGDVLLFHDTNLYTAEALEVIIERLKGEGFEFVTIDDFCND